MRFRKNPALIQPSGTQVVDQLHHPSPNAILSSKEPKMSQLFSNNVGSLNTTINFTVTGDRFNILAWLSPLDPRSRHKDIQGRRVENVGEWILQTEEFRSWYASSGRGVSDNEVLFCYGGPGVGKTYIR